MTKANPPRYFVEASRDPRRPMGAVHFYAVNERRMDAERGPYISGLERFSVRMLGDAEAMRRANAMRDDLMAGSK